MSATELEAVKTPEELKAQTHVWRRPSYDVAERDDAFDIRVNLPGVGRDGLDISMDGDILNITGTRTAMLPEGWRILRRELPEGDYRLNLRLNVAIDEGKISAHIEDGILDLCLPKSDEVKPRKIKVS